MIHNAKQEAVRKDSLLKTFLLEYICTVYRQYLVLCWFFGCYFAQIAVGVFMQFVDFLGSILLFIRECCIVIELILNDGE